MAREQLENIVHDDARWETPFHPGEDNPNLPDGLADDSQSLESMPPLADSLSGLAEVVGELKEQLKQSIRVNEVLEADLGEANQRLANAAEDREMLEQKIREMEEENSTLIDLRAEIDQLALERDTLANKVHDLGLILTTSEKRVQETSEILDRFRAERNDAIEEAVCLDSQFSRAMKVIEELRSNLAQGERREAELEQRIKRLEHHLSTSVAERDTYREELAESLQTLEEVRQSILAANREVEHAHSEE